METVWGYGEMSWVRGSIEWWGLESQGVRETHLLYCLFLLEVLKTYTVLSRVQWVPSIAHSHFNSSNCLARRHSTMTRKELEVRGIGGASRSHTSMQKQKQSWTPTPTHSIARMGMQKRVPSERPEACRSVVLTQKFLGTCITHSGL